MQLTDPVAVQLDAELSQLAVELLSALCAVSQKAARMAVDLAVELPPTRYASQVPARAAVNLAAPIALQLAVELLSTPCAALARDARMAELESRGYGSEPS